MARFFLLFFLTLFAFAPAFADERIKDFNVDIRVETNGDIIVTENILIQDDEGQRRRGIFRDLPRTYLDGKDTLPYDYDILSIKRGGRAEKYDRSKDGNAFKIRIGDANVYLPNGEHQYQIQYRVGNQIRRHDNRDELYWNVTGTYWAYPIEQARATIYFPEGARLVDQNAYTGTRGSSNQDYAYTRVGEAHQFTARNVLNRREGLTVSASVAKGIIAPMSSSEKSRIWWLKNASLVVLLGSVLGLLGYYYRNWSRVGRDPAKGPVFARYEPPKGYSPAAVSRIHYKGFSGHKALTATLLSLAIKDQIFIETEKKKTTLRLKDEAFKSDLFPEDASLLRSLLGSRNEMTLGRKYNSIFTSAYRAFQKAGDKDYGKSYYRRNAGYTIVGVIISIIAVIFAMSQLTSWKPLYGILLMGLAGLNVLFMFLMPAPSKKGQEMMTEIEGFKLYLETAEKMRLNAVEVGSDAPPPMTIERYEKFLPYAVALGVEKPWTKHFEAVMPVEAENYNPHWSNMNSRDYGSIGGMNKAITKSMNSGVSGSMPQSSSSSGSGGGGQNADITGEVEQHPLIEHFGDKIEIGVENEERYRSE